MSAIAVDQITKQFPGEARPAVDGVSFDVAEGTFVVLLGPSGCGKTTLLKLINRLYEPTSGRILIGGQDTRDLKVTELRRRIGYAIQQNGLFPHMRVEQNIAVVPRLLGWPQPRIDARIDELLALVGLPHSYRRRYPRQLSGGEQQRVGLARALAADPALLLMDEPFGALDAITRTRLQDELMTIQRQLRKTILFVTHDVEEALRLADQILILREGAVVQYDTPVQILGWPRNPFVHQLIGAEDVLRHLSLIPLSALLAARAPGQQRLVSAAAPAALSVRPDADLRHALGLLLRSDTGRIAIVNEAGVAIGQLSFEDLRGILPRHAAPSAVEG